MSKEPLKYEQITADLLERIRSGELKPGDRVPSERTLAAYYHVARLTARRALSDLEQRGLVLRDSRHGTTVLETIPEEKFETLTLLCSARPSSLLDEAVHVTLAKAHDHKWITRVIRVMPNDETPILEAIKLGNPTMIFGSPSDIWPAGRLERVIAKAGSHIVIVGGQAESDTIPTVMRDDTACMQMAIQTLRNAGHTRIALLTHKGAGAHPVTSPQITAWQNLMRTEMSEEDVQAHLLAINADLSRAPIKTVYDWLKDYLCSPESIGITALIALNEELGTAAVAACEAVGRTVPNRMSILDYTWVERTGLAKPPRAGIATCMNKHIDIAMKLLDEMHRHIQPEKIHYRLPPHFVEGASIATRS